MSYRALVGIIIIIIWALLVSLLYICIYCITRRILLADTGGSSATAYGAPVEFDTGQWRRNFRMSRPREYITLCLYIIMHVYAYRRTRHYNMLQNRYTYIL